MIVTFDDRDFDDITSVVIVALIGLLCLANYYRLWSSTFVELAFLALCRWNRINVSFFSYFFSKLFMSFAVFFFEQFTRDRSKYSKMIYKLGFKSDKWHAGVSYNGRLYHYAFPSSPVAPTKKDSSFDLTAQEHKKPSSDLPTTFEIPCGSAFAGFTSNEILALLESCGRCHNWALITIYELSADKFFSMTMLSFLRWDVWTVIVINGFALLCSYHFIGDLFAGFLTECLFIALMIFDVANMRTPHLKRNAMRAMNHRTSFLKHPLTKLFLLFLSNYLFETYLFSSLTPSLEFYCLLFLSFVLSLFMYFFDKYF